MRRYIQKIKSKLRFRDLFWPGLNVLTKVVTTGASTKILASLLTPIQYGMFGNYFNIFQILFSPSSTALTNYTISLCDRSGGHTDDRHLTQFFWMTIALNFLIVAGFLLASPLWTFFNVDLSSAWLVILMMGCLFQPLFSIVSALINGSGDLPRFVTFSVLYGLIGTGLTFYFCHEFGYNGALWSLLTNGISVFFISQLGLFKIQLKKLLTFSRQSFSKKKYLNFLTMALAGSIISPFTHILLRKIIEHNIDATTVGYWQGFQRISELYMSVVISFVSVLYLPELTVAKNYHQVKQAIYRGLGIVLPVGIITVGITILFSHTVLSIFLTSEFSQFSSEARIFFFSDFFRLITHLANYIFVGRAITTGFITLELAYSALRLFFYYYLSAPAGGTTFLQDTIHNSMTSTVGNLAYAQVYSAFAQMVVGAGLIFYYKSRIKSEAGKGVHQY